MFSLVSRKPQALPACVVHATADVADSFFHMLANEQAMNPLPTELTTLKGPGPR